MDANGLKFWMLADESDWQFAAEPRSIHYDRHCQTLQLASNRTAIVPSAPNLTEAQLGKITQAHLAQIPQVIDPFGTRAFWDVDRQQVMAAGAIAPHLGAVPIYPTDNTTTTAPTDLAIDANGVLYLAIAGQIVMQDLRSRWPSVTVGQANFSVWRLAAATDGVWAIGKSTDAEPHRLAKLTGMPRPPQPQRLNAAIEFCPCPANDNPPRLTIFPIEIQDAVAIAARANGDVAILTENGLQLLDAIGTLKQQLSLASARFAYSLAWLGDDRLAVLVSGWTEALVYDIDDRSGEIAPIGDFYPLRNYAGGAFLHGLTLPPHYPTASGSTPLHPLSLPTYSRRGEATSDRPFDSHNPQTIWHRLYLEAEIPPNCGIQVYLAVSDRPTAPTAIEDWYEHRFGLAADGITPCGAWVSAASEIPFHSGWVKARSPDHAGLFTVLIQRSNRRVRSLQGRYLWVRVVLTGDGRTTPQIYALRAYGDRFSYLNQYLPELYRETCFGSEADQLGSSTAADFLERFLDNFEGILTPIEDRIAQAHLLTDPRTVPEESLEWLGSWLGVSFDPIYPIERRRQLLESIPQLYRQRGTLAGLQLAIEVATGGGVSSGEIVVLEDFRLRRTFATILGADLADEADPLLGGMAISGNSIVGDALILGDQERKAFLALFAADLDRTKAEEDAIAALFDRLAHRVTILVHQSVAPQDLGLIRRIVELEIPAHVQAQILTASLPLLQTLDRLDKPALTPSDTFQVGTASLVAIDTYLTVKPQPQPVKLNHSQLGVRDRIQRPPSLDPRLETSE